MALRTGPPPRLITVPLLRRLTPNKTVSVLIPNRTTGVHSTLYTRVGRLRRQPFVPETQIIGTVWCVWLGETDTCRFTQPIVTLFPEKG